ncbi:phosphonate C-P lyase system protein PhnH [Bradyrhizobium sp. LA2.1]|uniref:phosphonate C-P lyase system protein PhnH n=1 Tax=Bradyrhizobium sp. LA2.1 TaxID=3156376 RepID=UPI00339641C2
MTFPHPTAQFSIDTKSDAVQHAQASFRVILRAFSHPGKVIAMPPISHAPRPMSQSMLSAALCLLDGEVSTWLDPAFRTKDIEEFLRLRTGVSISSHPMDVDFALIGDANEMPDLERFRAGTLLAPNRSATLLIQLPSLVGGVPISLYGPGIEAMKSVSPSGLPSWFWSSWETNAAQFPLGVDVLFVDGGSVLGLPRSVRRGTPCS